MPVHALPAVYVADQGRDQGRGQVGGQDEQTGQPWVPMRTACQILGRTRSDAVYLIDRGYLDAHRDSAGHWQIDLQRLLDYRYDEEGWVSHAEAALVSGVPTWEVKHAASAGDITKRNLTHARPSLAIASVLVFGLRREQQRRLDAATRFGDTITEQQRRAAWSPPPDPGGADPWLAPETAARILRCSASSVRSRARTGRLPATRVGERWWLRRSHVEIVAASQAFTWRTAVPVCVEPQPETQVG